MKVEKITLMVNSGFKIVIDENLTDDVVLIIEPDKKSETNVVEIVKSMYLIYKGINQINKNVLYCMCNSDTFVNIKETLDGLEGLCEKENT